ncbi:MAG: NADH:flavin oxidoreductase [Halioglobus sp.]
MSGLFTPLSFNHGPSMKNRFMLAPLTNCQSGVDGVLSDDEFHWLTLRARGGFGLTMTCAAHVQRIGQGFPGQLGIWSDEHLPGLTRLAKEIKAHDSVAICQLHHAGMRSPEELIGEAPVCPSVNERAGARELSLEETEQLIEDFIIGAVRAEQAGFDGVELHGAHGYILCQYFSASINHRTDRFGGSIENRFRILFDIIDGIRARCGSDFMVGVRLSPERFGMQLPEVLEIAQQCLLDERLDFLDMSLWDIFKEPEDPQYAGKTLLQHFAALERGSVRLGVAGNIRNPEQAEQALAENIDWIMLGRAAILNHDFPAQYQQDSAFVPAAIPVTRAHLRNEGLSDGFIDYFGGNWPENLAD